MSFIFSLIFVLLFTSQTGNVYGQFSYAHKTEIVYNNEPGFALDQKVNTLAYSLNRHLNSSLFFDASFIRDPQKTREYHLKQKPNQAHTGKPFNVYTDDGVTLDCTFFDRNSDTLLIVGGGFTNERELMSPFIDMFPDYNIVLFDYRGHGYQEAWSFSLGKKLFGVDTSLVRFGADEDKDVFAVVDGFKKLRQHTDQNPYTSVFGLGLCYSAFIFAKTAAVHPGLFNKLVLDGCWQSLPLFVDKIKGDFKTLCDPQSGGWSDHWFFSKETTKAGIEFVATKIFGVQLSDISLLDYIGNIKDTPVLFFYGKDDYMVYRPEFEALWNALKTKEKTAIITSNAHVRNHLKQKELYKLSCDLFFELPQDTFISYLRDSSKIIAHHTSRLEK